jgi:dipeptidyl aminopeptidase/acylaminoacyl peptidase
MRDEILDQLCWNGHRYVTGAVRGIAVRFHGLGAMNVKAAADWSDLELANQGALVVEAFQDPWGWMNDATRDLFDEIIEGLRARYGLDPSLPLIATGASMGGHAALAYCFKSRHRVTACQANCPVCDLPHHFGERPDLPRTFYHAYGRHGDIIERLTGNSPLHQAAHMPDIPYQILHGGEDKSVSKQRHSDRLVATLRGRGLRVEYIEVPKMGHCGPFPTYSVYRRFIDFIGENLAPVR